MSWALAVVAVVAVVGMVAVMLNDHRRVRHHDEAARVISGRDLFGWWRR